MEELQVYYEKKRVGVLRRDDDLVYSFSYESSWIEDKGSFPLSLAMPLSQKDYGNKISLSFFENLLPEGEVLENLEKGRLVQGPFDFLKEFGSDCAGAITVTREGPLFSDNLEQSLVEIKRSQIDLAITQKRSVAGLVADLNPGYLSLAGAQDKFPAIFKEGRFYLSTSGAPTTHIVKVPIWRRGIKESVYNEYYVMELARRMGFSIPHCEVLEGDHPLFVIERYDRQIDSSGKIHRIHQQDFCQAQGLTSEFKYEQKGGPTIKQNYDLIVKNVSATKRFSAIYLYLDWICFNLLVGNNDSHSKNISFLLRDGKIELAPFYDLLCSAIYPQLKKNFSFMIGGRDDVARIGINQFEQQELLLGVKAETLRERMTNVYHIMMQFKDEVANEVCQKYPQSKIPKRIAQLIERRGRGLAKQGVMLE